MPFLPIFLLLGAGAAIFALSRSSSSESKPDDEEGGKVDQKLIDEIAKPKTAADVVVVDVAPQALSRENKIKLIKALPDSIVIEAASSPAFDAGRIVEKKIKPKAGEKSAPAMPTLLAANEANKAIVVSNLPAEDKGAKFLVVEGGSENGYAKKGSEWFIAFLPGEIVAIAEAEKIALPSAAAEDPGASVICTPVDKMTGRCEKKREEARKNAGKLLGKNIGKALNVAARGPAKTDLGLVPGPAGDNARKAFASSDPSSMGSWAASLYNLGYHTAAKQLADKASSLGWVAGEGNADPFFLLSVDQILKNAQIAGASGGAVRTPSIQRLGHVRLALMEGKADWAEEASNWDNVINWMTDRIAERDRVRSGIIYPEDARRLADAADTFYRAGYPVAAGEFKAFAKIAGFEQEIGQTMDDFLRDAVSFGSSNLISV